MTIDLLGDLVFEGVPGFVIKGIDDPAFPLAMMTFDGGSVGPRAFFKYINGDASERPYVAAAPSGTFMTLKRLGEGSIVERCSVVGRADYQPIYGPSSDTAYGDSAWTINTCGGVTFRDNYARGMPDKMFYFTGGSDTGAADDTGDHLVIGNFGDRCDSFLSTTRQMNTIRVIGNRTLFCRLGIARTEAGEGVEQVDPGRTMIAIGNMFEKTESRVVRLHGGGGDVIANNQVIDWGYRIGWHHTVGYDGCSAPVWGQNSVVSNNVMMFRDWVPTATHRAVRIDDIALTSGTHVTTGCEIDGNIFMGTATNALGECIVELPGTGRNGGNNTFINVTTPVTTATGPPLRCALRRQRLVLHQIRFSLPICQL